MSSSTLAAALAARPRVVNRVLDTVLGAIAGVALFLLVQHGWQVAHPPAAPARFPAWYAGPASDCRVVRVEDVGAEQPGPHPMGYVVDGEWLCAAPVATPTPAPHD